MDTGDRVSEASPNGLIYCEEGRCLLERFGKCVHEVMLLHSSTILTSVPLPPWLCPDEDS